MSQYKKSILKYRPGFADQLLLLRISGFTVNSPYLSATPFAASLSLRLVEEETLLSLDIWVLYARE